MAAISAMITGRGARLERAGVIGPIAPSARPDRSGQVVAGGTVGKRLVAVGAILGVIGLLAMGARLAG